MKKYVVILFVIFLSNSVFAQNFSISDLHWENIEDNDGDGVRSRGQIVFTLESDIGDFSAYDLEIRRRKGILLWTTFTTLPVGQTSGSEEWRLYVSDIDGEFDFEIRIANPIWGYALEFGASDDSDLDDIDFEPFDEDILTFEIVNALWVSSQNVDNDNDNYYSFRRLKYYISKSSPDNQPSYINAKIYKKLASSSVYNSYCGESGYFDMTSSPNIQYLDISNLDYNLYDFKILIYNDEYSIIATLSANDDSDLNNKGFESTADDTPCLSPSWTNVGETSQTWVNVSWSSVSGAEGYQMIYREVGESWQTINGVGTSGAITGLDCDTDYELKVRTACSGGNYSDWTSTVEFSTAECPCEAPTGISSTPTEQTTAELNWNSVSNAVSYEIRYKEIGGSWVNLTTTNSYYNITGLACGTTYTWEVRTNCGSGNFSNWAQGAYIITFDCSTVLVANFSANQTIVSMGDYVNFTDQSTGLPTNWSWTFDGGTPSSSTNQSPTIQYNTTGIYAVSLTVTNGSESSSETKTSYIVVVDINTNNIALSSNGSTAFAISEGIYAGVTHYAYMANDGDVNTSWTSHWSMPAWLQIDFDEIYQVDSVGIIWSGHNQKFSISLSEDGQNWTEVVPETWSNTNAEYIDGTYYGSDIVYQGFSISQMNAKHMKIDVVESSAPSGHIFKAIISELKAFGSVESSTWSDGFETYSFGSFPSNWVADANASALSTNYVDNEYSNQGNQSLKLYGTIGGCWGALAYRSLQVEEPFNIQIAIKNGNESLSGCHPDRAGLGLRQGTSWNNSSRSLIRFKGDGTIISGGEGVLLGTFNTEEWYLIKVRYEKLSSSTIKLSYWINNTYKGSETIATISDENQLTNLELHVQEGYAWFDDITIDNDINTDIDEVGNVNTINIYPNPTNGVLYLPINLKIHKIRIYNMIGKLVFEDNFNKEIDISKFKNGIYVLKQYSRDGKNLKTEKIILNK